jgi:hypothetical protein
VSPVLTVDDTAWAARRVHEHLPAEEDEVDRARDLHREERGLGGEEQRGDARACGQGPHGLPGRDAEGGEDAGPAAAEQRAADRERRVLARRGDDKGGDTQEGE